MAWFFCSPPVLRGGRSVGDKVQEFLESGTMALLEEYRSGERGL